MSERGKDKKVVNLDVYRRGKEALDKIRSGSLKSRIQRGRAWMEIVDMVEMFGKPVEKKKEDK